MFSHYNLKQVFFHFFFLILFVAALVLYKERLFMDSALVIFKVLNDGWFYIVEGNILLLFSQLLPLTAYCFGAGLKLLLVLFSVSHVLVYYLIFLFINYKLKDEAAAMILILSLFIAQLWTFYTPSNEIGYGVVLSIVFYSILRKGHFHKNTHYAALIIIAYFILRGDYLNYLLFLFILVFDIINKGFTKKPHLPLFFMVPLLYVLKSMNYEYNESTEALATLSKFDLEGFFYFTGTSVRYFPDLIFAFILLIYFLHKAKKSTLVKFILISMVAYLLILLISNGANQELWYIEMSFKPLIAMVLILFFYEVYLSLPLKGKKIVFLFFALVIIVRSAVTWIYGESIRERSDQLERLVYTSLNEEGSKFLINEQNIQKNHSSIFFPTSMETLLLSSIKGKEHSLSIAVDSLFYERLYKRNQKKREFYAGKYGFMADSTLNMRFFNIESGKYHHLNSAEFKYPKELLKDSVKLELLSENKIFEIKTTKMIFCRISNFSKYPLPSNINSNIRISYHIYNANHEIVEWDGLRTPIEMDILTYHDQFIEVKMPEKAGVYFIQPDILIEGDLWMGNEEKFEVKVF